MTKVKRKPPKKSSRPAGPANLVPYQFEKGMTKHPDANKTFKPEAAGYSFSKQFIRDMAEVYKRLGGKKFLLAHVKLNPQLSEKFIDKLVKIAANEQAREIKMEVSGSVQHDHVHRYGFDLENVAGLMQQIRAGEINIKSLLETKVPALPKGEEHILADVVNVTPEKVESKKLTLEELWDMEGGIQ